CDADLDGVAGACQNLCQPCEVFQSGECVPRQCGGCETCDPTTDQCTSTCGSGQACCSDTCVNPRVPGDGAVCCEWNGNPFACGAGEQCAGNFGCCSAGAEVCVTPSGSGQCCDSGLVCGPLGLCCNPLPYPQCIGTACCYNQH